MARRTTWSDSAQADLQQIFEYIAADSVQYADNVVARIVDSVDRLVEFPYSGRKVSENPAFREIIVGNYRVIHEISDDEIFVVGVIHGRRSVATDDASA